MSGALTIHHGLCDVVLKPHGEIDSERLKGLIRSTLDLYLAEECIAANVVHEEAKYRHGNDYGTPGHHLRLYRLRADLTQTALAEKAGIRQHHLSEMERNKRPLGKVMARKLAKILDCNYQKLL